MRTGYKFLFGAAVGLAASAPRSAFACPDCPTQLEARADVVANEPVQWLLISLAPFVAIALVATAAYRIGLPRPDRERNDE